MKVRLALKRDGFTLVELSVVLVIIGLLIGGILVAQSLIDSAKVNALIRQLQQYDGAVAQFKSKYNQLPGDDTHISGGNDDGLIGNAAPANFTGEFAEFWEALSRAGILQQTYRSDQTAWPQHFVIDYHFPQAKIGTDSTTFIAAGYTNNWAAFSGENVWAIMEHGSSWPRYTGNTSIPIMQVVSIEGKIDDGSPTSGDIKATAGFYPNTGGVYTPSYAWPGPTSGTDCVSGLVGAAQASTQWATGYNTDSTELCAIVIRMLSQVGGE